MTTTRPLRPFSGAASHIDATTELRFAVVGDAQPLLPRMPLAQVTGQIVRELRLLQPDLVLYTGDIRGVSKPGNLANFMPKKPPALIDARDDIIVLDLMRMPKIANNLRLRRMLQRLTPVVNVSALKTEGDFLIVALRATPAGFPRALSAARG